MIERFKQGRLRWINLKSPTVEEVQTVMRELDLSPLLLADLTSVVPKNYIVRVDDTIKIALDFPTINHLDAKHQFEVKFLISKNSLLTIQYEEMQGIERFKRQYEVASMLRKKQTKLTGLHLFMSLFSNLYDTVGEKIDNIESQLSTIEADIFKNNEKKMVYDISTISKKIIAFRHVMNDHDGILSDFQQQALDVFGKDLVYDVLTTQKQYYYLKRRSDMQFETLTALRETNAAMLNTKQNEVIKTLTIMAFVTFPLTLFSSIFGMNTTATPLIGNDHDFWIIIGIMFMAAISFFMFFKYKNWM